MAGPYKGSFYFSTDDEEGWSENFYMTEADIDTAATAFQGYIPLRLALSPSNVNMNYAKVSDVTIKGDSLIVVPTSGPFPQPGTYVETPTGAFLEANTALLIEILATPSKKNRLFLRGLSLDVVTGREYLAPSGFATALTTLLTWIKTHTQVRTQVKPHTIPPTYTYADTVNAYLNGVTARKPGRPFGLPRGRKFAHRAA